MYISQNIIKNDFGQSESNSPKRKRAIRPAYRDNDKETPVLMAESRKRKGVKTRIRKQIASPFKK